MRLVAEKGEMLVNGGKRRRTAGGNPKRYPGTEGCRGRALLSRALRWVGEEAGKNMKRKAGSRKETWDFYCTSQELDNSFVEVTGPRPCVRD